MEAAAGRPVIQYTQSPAAALYKAICDKATGQAIFTTLLRQSGRRSEAKGEAEWRGWGEKKKIRNNKVGASGDILQLGDEGGNHKTAVMAGEPIRLTEQWGSRHRKMQLGGRLYTGDLLSLGTEHVIRSLFITGRGNTCVWWLGCIIHIFVFHRAGVFAAQCHGGPEVWLTSQSIITLVQAISGINKRKLARESDLRPC